MISGVKERVIENKLCSECNQIKTIEEFSLTFSGLRHKAYCKTCEGTLFDPKKTPKILGKAKGKPLLAGPEWNKPKEEPVIQNFKGSKPDFLKVEPKEVVKTAPKEPSRYRGTCTFEDILEDTPRTVTPDSLSKEFMTIYRAFRRHKKDSDKSSIDIPTLCKKVKWIRQKSYKFLNLMVEEGLLKKDTSVTPNLYSLNFFLKEEEEINPKARKIESVLRVMREYFERTGRDKVTLNILKNKLHWSYNKTFLLLKDMEGEGLIEVERTKARNFYRIKQ